MESTLTLLKSDFEAQIGSYLGYGRGASKGETAWTTAQQNDIYDVRDSGIRQFYYPQDVGGESYSWSFLRPVTSLLLANGGTIVTLPDDFGGLDEERITITTAGSTIYHSLTTVNEGRLREAFSSFPTANGQPELASIVPLRGTTNQRSSRYQLEIYPAANADYTLGFSYYLHPSALSQSHPYVYGGPAHSETILELCLAVAELRKDDIAGVHAARSAELLASSISQDRRLRPQHYGLNRDRSDDRYGYDFQRRRLAESLVTFNGIVPS